MAHKKGAGSTKNGRDSKAKRLGVKIYGGNYVKKGQIIVRQRGYSFKAGSNLGVGKDYTLFALTDGYVCYENNKTVTLKLPLWEKVIKSIGYSNWSSFHQSI